MVHRIAVRPLRAGLLVVLLALTAACSEAPPAATTAEGGSPVNATLPAKSAQPAANTLPTESTKARTQRLWADSCALCHIDGNGGAPRLGYADEWAPRVAQGAEVLLNNTVEGLGNMPPLGYCMACDRDDFNRLIAFMSGTAHE